MRPFNIDVHVHPGLKPYGTSFSLSPQRVNNPDPAKKNSIWFKDHPNDLERLVERSLGLVRFTQSDFQSLVSGNVGCICASLYSIERGLVRLKTGSGWFTDLLTNFISGLGKPRINFLQNNNDYFSDLVGEYEFYRQLNGRIVAIRGVPCKYVLVDSWEQMQTTLDNHNPANQFKLVIVIITIEGMHNLDANMDDPAGDENQFLANVDKLKQWEFKPLFVTFAHHFYNKLCGHAESLADKFQDGLTRQEQGMDTEFTPLGWKVLEKLLDNTSGRRIYIDIKHMSYKSRQQYFNYLLNTHHLEFANRLIPIIVSHGACNGFRHAQDKTYTPGLAETAKHMYDKDINFYDEEILTLAKSGGIIGLQLDERRIANAKYKIGSRKIFASKFKRQLSNSRMVWNNIQHIAMLLDQNELPAWNNMTIGSDYDGLIDSVNLFWSAADLPDLAKCLTIKAGEWMSGGNYTFKLADNRLSPEEIIDKLFYRNAMDFFRKYFITTL
ncbi:MAG: hypothetical protein SH818_04800 [Saprospiraceae bacterium]|nr:hypothetical protein [Saprospiraceae bacterium]